MNLISEFLIKFTLISPFSISFLFEFKGKFEDNLLDKIVLHSFILAIKLSVDFLIFSEALGLTDSISSCTQLHTKSSYLRKAFNNSFPKIKKFPNFDVFSHISFIVFIFLFSICRHKISMPSNISESLLSDNFIFSVSVLFFVLFNNNFEP